MPQSKIDYKGAEIGVPATPVPERVGTWWRRRWHLVLNDGVWESPMIPPPVADIRDIALVVTANRVSETELCIEVFSVSDVLTGDELTYVSTVAVWLARRYGQEAIEIEGVKKHPLLRMVRLSDEIVAALERDGY
jgi:hypothetical protein